LLVEKNSLHYINSISDISERYRIKSYFSLIFGNTPLLFSPPRTATVLYKRKNKYSTLKNRLYGIFEPLTLNNQAIAASTVTT
jgi:hypothetical protein